MSRSFFGPPPELPGDAEAREAAFQQERERSRRFWERQQVEKTPGGLARKRAESLLLGEARALARAERAEAGGDPAAAAWHRQNAADLRRFADEQIREASHITMTMTAKQIRQRMQQRLGAVAQRMALVRAEDDEQFPPEYQVKRGRDRDLLRREWQVIEASELDALNAWAREEQARAQALYHSDPIGDPAKESRRVSDALEIAGLAERYIGKATEVRNHLLPEARRYIALGLLDKAHVYLEAAKRAGVVATDLEQALTAAQDATIPHRRQALAQLQQVQDERDLFDHARYSARIAHGFGGESDQVRASTALKLAAARQGVQTGAAVVTAGTIPSVGEGGDGA